jgi:hypothetical protein
MAVSSVFNSIECGIFLEVSFRMEKLILSTTSFCEGVVAKELVE